MVEEEGIITASTGASKKSLRGLNNKHLLPVLQARSPRSRWAGLVSPKATVLDLRWLSSHCALTQPFICVNAFLGLSVCPISTNLCL